MQAGSALAVCLVRALALWQERAENAGARALAAIAPNCPTIAKRSRVLAHAQSATVKVRLNHQDTAQARLMSSAKCTRKLPTAGVRVLAGKLYRKSLYIIADLSGDST